MHISPRRDYVVAIGFLDRGVTPALRVRLDALDFRAGSHSGAAVAGLWAAPALLSRVHGQWNPALAPGRRIAPSCANLLSLFPRSL